MEDKITVVITSYNIADSVGICLHELQHQTFNYFNIVVIDDCSTDNTRFVVDSYKEVFRDRLLTIFCEKNNGSPGAVRNIVLDSNMITGKYVIFLDGDDNIEPNMLERLYITAENENADIVCCAYNRVNKTDKFEYSKEMLNFYVKSIEPSSNLGYIPFVNGSLWNKLISVKAIGEYRLPPMRVGEDASFLLKVLISANKTVFIDDVLIHYNVTGHSLMSTIPKEQIYKFGGELVNQYLVSSDSEKGVIILSAFIHIGISMTVRAFQSKNINTHEHLVWTKKYFNDNFTDWFGSKYLKLNFLKQFGIKGIAVWGCKILLKINCLRVFLWAYSFMIKVIGKDVKW